VSSVVDDYETNLSNEMQQTSHLYDLDFQIPTIEQQSVEQQFLEQQILFLEQYGISTNVMSDSSQIAIEDQQFLVQQDINTHQWNHEQPHQDQVQIFPSSSSISALSSEVESFTQTTLDAPNEINENDWIQNEDFVIPANDMSGNCIPVHDVSNYDVNDILGSWKFINHASNDLGSGDNIFDFSAFEQDVLGDTSASGNYEVP
jgi:hypothetical protein